MNAVPIVSTGFGWTPILLTMANLLIGGVFVTLIRTRPALKKIASEDRAADFERLRSDIVLAREESKDAKDIASRLENMVACMRPAISILIAEIRRLDHDSTNNAALMQVTELMTMAATGDLGNFAALTKLAGMRGARE